MSNFKLLIKYLSFNNIRCSSIVLLLQINFPLLQTHLSHYYALKSNGGENLRYCEYKSDTNSDEYNYNLVMIIRLQFFRQS